MKSLKLYPASDIDELASPGVLVGLNLDSPALDFFTDFLKVKPLVLESSISALDASKLMQKAHVRLKFILDDEGHFIGIVDSDALADSNFVQKVSEGAARDEIALTEFMTPRKRLKALAYEEVADATISDVIHALKDSGQQHCLVIDKDSRQVRGIFSASDISRKLQLPINIQDTSSFYKVFSATE